LIPEWLHWSQDDPKTRGKKKGFGGERVGVNLSVLGWKLSVFKEEALREYKPVAKDTMEFFLVLARVVSEKLGLPVAIGSHRLGERLMRSCSGKPPEPLSRLLDELKDWPSWCRSDVVAAQRFLLPVPLYDAPNCREWFLLNLTSAVEGETLGSASRLRVDVAERNGRTVGPFKIRAQRLAALIRGEEAGVAESIEVECQRFPADATALDTTLAVLGLVWAQVSDAAGVSRLDIDSPAYLADWRAALAEAFAHLRRQADKRGDGAVEKSFAGRDECLWLLNLLARRSADIGTEPDARIDQPRIEVAASGPAREGSRLVKLLT
jgi:hypothetical protein